MSVNGGKGTAEKIHIMRDPELYDGLRGKQYLLGFKVNRTVWTLATLFFPDF